MKLLKKILSNLLTIITIFLWCGTTAFAYIPSPLAPYGSHKKGINQDRYFDYLKHKIQEIANSKDPNYQKNEIEYLFKKYTTYNHPMPSVEPQFILDLCKIISKISNDEIKLLIFTRVLFPLMHKQLIYDLDKANFWSNREHDEFDRINEYDAPTFKRRIYCDFFRVLKSKRGVCRNFTSVIKVILDRIGIQNLLIFSETHIFNAYLLNKESEWRICDLTWGQNGEADYLFPPEERHSYCATAYYKPKGYLDCFFKCTEDITVVFVDPKDYFKLYDQVIYRPDSFLKIKFNPTQKKRKTTIISHGNTISKSISGEDIKLLLS